MSSTTICSNNSKKIDTGDPINTHTHTPKEKDENEIVDRLCPLLSIKEFAWCRGQECAWFDFDNDACAVLALVRVLDAIYEWESSRA